MRSDEVNRRNAARLACNFGISLLREECCYRELIGYLRFALKTEPALEDEFFRFMNNPAAETWGMWTQILLAVASKPDRPVRC